MKIIQLSDLHLTEGGQPLFGSVPEQRLAAALDTIVREHADAEFCLLTGDLAENGSEAVYRRLASMLAALPMPSHVLPGNHDHRPAMARVFPVHGEAFHQQAVPSSLGVFLLLDTVCDGQPWGAFDALRGAWLTARLAETAPAPVWLVMHHPPFAVGIPSMDQYALRDPQWFLAAVMPERERIRHLLFGHLHRAIGLR